MLLKLESGGAADWFLGFNRVSGVNSESQQATNQVTLFKVNGGDGFKYSQSALKGVLGGGRSATINNWRQSGQSLTIRVTEINTQASPGYASVEVLFGPQPEPTPPPTKEPTAKVRKRSVILYYSCLISEPNSLFSISHLHFSGTKTTTLPTVRFCIVLLIILLCS